MRHLLYLISLLTVMIILLSNTSAAQGPFWQQVHAPYGGMITALAVSQAGTVYAGTDGAGVFRSTDHGNTWTSVLPGKSIHAICIDSSGGVIAGNFRSTDNGGTWKAIGLPLGSDVFCLIPDKSGNLFAGINGGGIWKSMDNGTTWKEVDTTNSSVYSLAVGSSGELYAGLATGVVRSTDSGLTWANAGSGLPVSIVWSLTVATNGNILAGTQQGVYRSSDGGNTWHYTLPTYWTSAINVMCLASSSPGTVVAGLEAYGIIISSDNGVTWSQVNNGLRQSSFYAITIDLNGLIFAGSYGDGVFCSTDNGQKWNSQKDGLTAARVQCMTFIGSTLYAGTEGGGVFHTTDYGNTWIQDTVGLSYPYVRSIAATPEGHLFAGTGTAGIYRSTDMAATWQLLNGPSYTITSITIDSIGHLFAGTDQNGIFLSTDDGSTWTSSDSGLVDLHIINIIAGDSGIIFAATWGGLFRSTDYGKSWVFSETGLPNNESGGTAIVYNITRTSNGTLFVSCRSLGPLGVYYSTNNGTNWQLAGLRNTSISYLVEGSNGVIYAFGTVEYNAYDGSWTFGTNVNVSPDNGLTWNPVDSSYLDGSVISAMIGPNRHLFAGTKAGFFQSVQNVHSTAVLAAPVPSSFDLSQNYPNPFNPSTNIAFSLSSKYFVTLKVFDVLGREVETIVSEEMSAGSYSKQWNAKNMSSGIYFYRLQAGSFSTTKKLVLLK